MCEGEEFVSQWWKKVKRQLQRVETACVSPCDYDNHGNSNSSGSNRNDHFGKDRAIKEAIISAGFSFYVSKMRSNF